MKLDSAGYPYVMLNENGKTKFVREHRHIMELFLGRKLMRDEHVHHINGVKDDNRIQNLQVLTAKEHLRLHYKQAPELHIRRTQKSTLKIKEKWKKIMSERWSPQYDSCSRCGLTTSPHQGLGKCEKCYMVDYMKKLKEANLIEKSCASCGLDFKTFKRKRTEKIVCSYKCKLIYMKKKYKEARLLKEAKKLGIK